MRGLIAFTIIVGWLVAISEFTLSFPSCLTSDAMTPGGEEFLDSLELDIPVTEYRRCERKFNAEPSLLPPWGLPYASVSTMLRGDPRGGSPSPRALRTERRLKRALSGSDKLEIWRAKPLERGVQILEEHSLQAITGFIRSIALEEESNEFCLCSGSALLLFYKGRRRVARITLHHGTAMMWGVVETAGNCRETYWSAGARLTTISSGGICDWLALRGLEGPKYERLFVLEATRQEEEAYLSLIPRKLLRLLETDYDDDAIREGFNSLSLARGERVLLCFRIFGCRERPWHEYSRVEIAMIRSCLARLSEPDVKTFLKEAPQDRAAKQGFSRWILGEGRWRSLDSDLRQAAVEFVGKWAVADPIEMNRRRSIRALGDINSDSSIGLLLGILRSGVEVRKDINRACWAEPAVVRVDPRDGDVPLGCSDQVHAALILCRLGVEEIRNQVAAMSKCATGVDKAVLDMAIKALDERVKARGDEVK